MYADQLANAPRLLMKVELEPAQGSRFQPTGFPDLGAAVYSHNSARMVLVESAQSMANRLENVLWDEGANDLQKVLAGLPYVRSEIAEGVATNSILEAHRLNSPYIVNSAEFDGTIKAAVGFEAKQPFDRRKLARALLQYDPNSLLHGIFLEKIAGTVRLPRMLSGFIEATDVDVAASGGVKFDRVQPATSDTNTAYGKAKDGYGNVPYHRDEYTAGAITAYFNLDLALLRGVGLGSSAEDLLIGLALYKIQRFLRDGLRLRTACDLAPKGPLTVTRPAEFEMPALSAIEKALPALIKAASGAFAQPAVTVVHYKSK